MRVPVLLLIVVLAAAAFLLHRSTALTVFTAGSSLLIDNLGDWEATIQTFSLVLFSTLVCVLFGVPIGIAAAHRPWVYKFLHPILDLMQTIPTFELRSVHGAPALARLFLLETNMTASGARNGPELN